MKTKFDPRLAETRSLGELSHLGVKQHVETQQRTLHGYAAVFWNPARPEATRYALRPGVWERILPGAFDEVLANPPPAPFDTLCLFDHEQSHLLGRLSSGTLRLAVDDTGLFYENDLPGTRLADDLIDQITRRDVQGSSFRFLGVEERMVREEGLVYRELLSFHWLIDVGPGIRTAYTGASAEISGRSIDAWLEGEATAAQHRRDRLRRLRLGALQGSKSPR